MITPPPGLCLEVGFLSEFWPEAKIRDLLAYYVTGAVPVKILFLSDVRIW